MEDERKPRFNGSFYPENQKVLEEMIESMKRDSHAIEREGVAGIIVPHAGYQYSGTIAASGYQTLANMNYGSVKTLFVIGPNHRGYPLNPVTDNHKFWSVPNGRMNIDTDLVEKLTASGFLGLDDRAQQVEHSLEVQVPMLLSMTKFAGFIPIIMGDQELDSVKSLFNVIRPYIENSVFVITSDLTHYLPDSVARKIDRQIIDSVLKLDFKGLYSIVHEGATPCGYGPMAFLMMLAENRGYKMELIDYGTSADASGDDRSVVGYGSIACH